MPMIDIFQMFPAPLILIAFFALAYHCCVTYGVWGFLGTVFAGAYIMANWHG